MSANVTKSKGAVVCRAKSPTHLYLLVPKFDREHSWIGRGKRSMDLVLEEFPGELSPKENTPEANLLDKAKWCDKFLPSWAQMLWEKSQNISGY